MDLLAPVRVRFDNLYLDPNNPRLGSPEKPGYADPEQLFSESVQVQLELRMRRGYKSIKNLVDSIVNMGWIPVDAVLAWEHPQAKGQYVVVEGNARTTALRMIRRDHDRELHRLAKSRGSGLVAQTLLNEQEERVERYQRVVAATREVEVFPVAARTPDELAHALPRLLGVRHISHAQQWKPYATNVYVYSLYRQLFEERRPGERLHLLEPLLRETAGKVSLTSWKVRRAVQAVVAFSRFRAGFEDRLPAGERFVDQDQNYFLYLFEPGYAHEQFGVSNDDLWLDRDMEDVLFQWAFSKPRGIEDGRPNHNVFRAPEDVRTWNSMARYDDRAKTHFSRMLDVNRAERARPIGEIEVDFLAHRSGRSPLETVRSLVDSLRRLEVDSLLLHKDEIKPAIEQLLAIGGDYLAMLEAIENPKPPRANRSR